MERRSSSILSRLRLPSWRSNSTFDDSHMRNAGMQYVQAPASSAGVSNPCAGLADWWRSRRADVVAQGSKAEKKPLLANGELDGDALARRGILLPMHPVKIAWDLLVGLFVVYVIVTLPVSLSFLDDSDLLQALDYCVIALYVLDMCVSARTAYVNKAGDFVIDSKAIAVHYCKKPMGFTLDFLSTFPYELINASLKPLRALKMMRLLRITHLGQIIPKRFTNFMRIMKLFSALVGAAHWFGCFWFAIANTTRNATRNDETPTYTWLDELEFEFPGLAERAEDNQIVYYVWSVYWAITTITTIGFGDITPQNEGEAMYSVLVMVVGASIYASIFGSFSMIISNMNQKSTAYDLHMDAISEYMNDLSLPRNLVDKVTGYYDYLYQHHKGMGETELLKDLPPSLMRDISEFCLGGMLTSCPLFEHADIAVIQAFSVKFVDAVTLPGDNVYKRGELGQQLIFVRKGLLRVMGGEHSDIVLSTRRLGSYVGDNAFLTEEQDRRDSTVVGGNYCEMCILSRDDLEELLSQFAEYRAPMRLIAHQRHQCHVADKAYFDDSLISKVSRQFHSRSRRVEKRRSASSSADSSETGAAGAGSSAGDDGAAPGGGGGGGGDGAAADGGGSNGPGGRRASKRQSVLFAGHAGQALGRDTVEGLSEVVNELEGNVSSNHEHVTAMVNNFRGELERLTRVVEASLADGPLAPDAAPSADSLALSDDVVAAIAKMLPYEDVGSIQDVFEAATLPDAGAAADAAAAGEDSFAASASARKPPRRRASFLPSSSSSSGKKPRQARRSFVAALGLGGSAPAPAPAPAAAAPALDAAPPARRRPQRRTSASAAGQVVARPESWTVNPFDKSGSSGAAPAPAPAPAPSAREAASRERAKARRRSRMPQGLEMQIISEDE